MCVVSVEIRSATAHEAYGQQIYAMFCLSIGIGEDAPLIFVHNIYIFHPSMCTSGGTKCMTERVFLAILRISRLFPKEAHLWGFSSDNGR